MNKPTNHLDILRDTVKRTEISDYSEQETKMKQYPRSFAQRGFMMLLRIFNIGLNADIKKAKIIYLAGKEMLIDKRSKNDILYKKYHNKITKQGLNIRNIHGILGIASELAELMIALIKQDKTEIKEEIGDQFWFLAMIADANGLTIEECIEANKRKLEARYKDKFTQDEALNRDLKKEEEALI